MSKSRKHRSKRGKRGAREPTASGPEPRSQEPEVIPPESGEAVPVPTESESVGPEPSEAVPRSKEPESPEPVREEPALANAEHSRRHFFRKAWLALGGLAVLEYLWVVVNFLRPRLTPEQEAGIVIAGPVERFEPSTVTAFQRGKFYLSRLEDGGLLALSRECTHLGCTVPWVEEEGRFVCPCHSSEYDEKGEVVSPPAPRPLDLFPIRIENGVVKVHTAEPQKRTYFDVTQVTQP